MQNWFHLRVLRKRLLCERLKNAEMPVKVTVWYHQVFVWNFIYMLGELCWCSGNHTGLEFQRTGFSSWLRPTNFSYFMSLNSLYYLF